IVNYPKRHLENGQAKQQASREWFKPTVRVFKNARTYLIDHGRLADGSAPSYFLQGLLYNVPNDRFGGTARQNLIDVLIWLGENANLFSSFWCQNGLVPLFGPTPEQWDEHEAASFMLALLKLDSEWQ